MLTIDGLISDLRSLVPFRKLADSLTEFTTDFSGKVWTLEILLAHLNEAISAFLASDYLQLSEFFPVFCERKFGDNFAKTKRHCHLIVLSLHAYAAKHASVELYRGLLETADDREVYTFFAETKRLCLAEKQVDNHIYATLDNLYLSDKQWQFIVSQTLNYDVTRIREFHRDLQAKIQAIRHGSSEKVTRYIRKDQINLSFFLRECLDRFVALHNEVLRRKESELLAYRQNLQKELKGEYAEVVRTISKTRVSNLAAVEGLEEERERSEILRKEEQRQRLVAELKEATRKTNYYKMSSLKLLVYLQRMDPEMERIRQKFAQMRATFQRLKKEVLPAKDWEAIYNQSDVFMKQFLDKGTEVTVRNFPEFRRGLDPATLTLFEKIWEREEELRPAIAAKIEELRKVIFNTRFSVVTDNQKKNLNKLKEDIKKMFDRYDRANNSQYIILEALYKSIETMSERGQTSANILDGVAEGFLQSLKSSMEGDPITISKNDLLEQRPKKSVAEKRKQTATSGTFDFGEDPHVYVDRIDQEVEQEEARSRQTTQRRPAPIVEEEEDAPPRKPVAADKRGSAHGIEPMKFKSDFFVKKRAADGDSSESFLGQSKLSSIGYYDQTRDRDVKSISQNLTSGVKNDFDLAMVPEQAEAENDLQKKSSFGQQGPSSSQVAAPRRPTNPIDDYLAPAGRTSEARVSPRVSQARQSTGIVEKRSTPADEIFEALNDDRVTDFNYQGGPTATGVSDGEWAAPDIEPRKSEDKKMPGLLDIDFPESQETEKTPEQIKKEKVDAMRSRFGGPKKAEASPKGTDLGRQTNGVQQPQSPARVTKDFVPAEPESPKRESVGAAESPKKKSSGTKIEDLHSDFLELDQQVPPPVNDNESRASNSSQSQPKKRSLPPMKPRTDSRKASEKLSLQPEPIAEEIARLSRPSQPQSVHRDSYGLDLASPEPAPPAKTSTASRPGSIFGSTVDPPRTSVPGTQSPARISDASKNVSIIEPAQQTPQESVDSPSPKISIHNDQPAPPEKDNTINLFASFGNISQNNKPETAKVSKSRPSGDISEIDSLLNNLKGDAPRNTKGSTGSTGAVRPSNPSNPQPAQAEPRTSQQDRLSASKRTSDAPRGSNPGARTSQPRDSLPSDIKKEVEGDREDLSRQSTLKDDLANHQPDPSEPESADEDYDSNESDVREPKVKIRLKNMESEVFEEVPPKSNPISFRENYASSMTRPPEISAIRPKGLSSVPDRPSQGNLSYLPTMIQPKADTTEGDDTFMNLDDLRAAGEGKSGLHDKPDESFGDVLAPSDKLISHKNQTFGNEEGPSQSMPPGKIASSEVSPKGTPVSRSQSPNVSRSDLSPKSHVAENMRSIYSKKGQQVAKATGLRTDEPKTLKNYFKGFLGVKPDK